MATHTRTHAKKHTVLMNRIIQQRKKIKQNKSRQQQCTRMGLILRLYYMLILGWFWYVSRSLMFFFSCDILRSSRGILHHRKKRAARIIFSKRMNCIEATSVQFRCDQCSLQSMIWLCVKFYLWFSPCGASNLCSH